MADNLDSYFVTIEIYEQDSLIHSMEVPRSMIQQAFVQYGHPETKYTVKVIDHTGNFRISSDIFY